MAIQSQNLPSGLMKRISVLFVCLGNICRSPLAEAIFKHKLKEKGWDEFIYADSCGTSNYHIGGSPDPRTIANATKNGIAIDHCGRQFSTDDFKSFDYILTMDSSNHKNIMRLDNSSKFAAKVQMMRTFDPNGEGDVPDPYHGGERGFQEVFDILDRSLENFLAHIGHEHHLLQR
jgi:protein-tyrosine phosphatase